MSLREEILATLFGRLQTIPLAAVKRNEALPQSVPAGGLIILRDGEPGEPDVTLNPRTEYYTHRVEIEAFAGDEAGVDALFEASAAALGIDRSLGGLAENLYLGAPETGALAIDGAAPIATGRATLIIEYLVGDPLATA